MSGAMHRCRPWLALVALQLWGTAQAAYPDRLITFVVPFTAGAAPDVFVRTLAREVGREAGVTVVVDNKPGAGSVLAAQAVARAAPDGYTVLVTGNVAVTGNPHVFKKLPYDPVADFTPVSTLSRGPMILYANPRTLPLSKSAELLQRLRAQPGHYTFAHTSITSRLPAELLQQSQGLKLVGIPYRSGAAAFPDLISGQVDMMFTDYSGWPHVDAGRLRAVAVTGRERSSYAPALPTFEELGIPGMDILFWLGAYLPANAPPAVVSALQRWFKVVAGRDTVVAAHKTSGTQAFLVQGVEMQRFQAQEREHWGRVIRAAGITPE